MRAGIGIGVSLLFFLGCARPAFSDSARANAVSTPLSAASAETQRSAPEPPRAAWVELMRMERWASALAALSGEPASVRDEPSARYAAAVAAERVGDAAHSRELLVGLEASAPLLASRIRALRARASLELGDYAAALEFFDAQSDALSRLQAAEAHAKLAEADAARARVEALLARLPRRASACAFEAPARRLRVELLPANLAAARASDYRWLALEAPLCASSLDADAALDAMPPAYHLKATERLSRAQAFADAGLVERVEHEVDVLRRSNSGALQAGTRDHLLGYARYQARSELERAATLLTAAASADALRADQSLFYAARAAERNGADDAARALYARVEKAYPKSSFAEQAAYRSAQLSFARGEFANAAQAYDAYLTRFGARARHAADARDERAVAWLVNGRAGDAAREFTTLAERARDTRMRARYSELEAVALLRDGKLERGSELLESVIRQYPLSFAALAASARLRGLGRGAPPLLPASPKNQIKTSPLQPALPPMAALLHAVGLDREAESALFDVEGSVQRSYAVRGDEALCLLYGKLASSERAFRVGQRAASNEELASALVDARRWLWDCVYPRPYSGLVEGAANDEALAPEFVYAIMRQESAFRPDARSPVQATGLLQIMPATAERVARELGVDFAPEHLSDPALNVRLGARYLKKLLGWFGGSSALAAAAYNAGPTAVLRWLKGSPTLELDVFVARIPYDETRAYVERVIANQARYRYLAGGESAVTELALTLPAPDTDGAELY